MSQFTYYSSADAGSPGLISGTAGSLITILRACLVDGYGAKAAAGWTEPVAAASNIAAFQQGAGSGFAVVINDNGPNATSTYKEAWATGWEVVAGVGSPVGTGTGQFPLPAQLLTTGHVVIRKSATADGTTRAWMVYADSRTFYLFILSGDAASIYTAFIFGDCYSAKSTADSYNCLIIGKSVENQASGAGSMQQMTVRPTTACAGCFLARTHSGAGASITMGHTGSYNWTPGSANYQGEIQYPNNPDNALYLSPITVFESSGGIVRGRLRGLYHVGHAVASFSDGDTFSGAGDFAGKTLVIVWKVENTNAFLAVETSNTVEQN